MTAERAAARNAVAERYLAGELTADQYAAELARIRREATRPPGWAELMALGRAVLTAEAVHGAGSVQHTRAVAAWRAGQARHGVTR